MNSFSGRLVVGVQERFTDDGIRHLESSLGRSTGDSQSPKETSTTIKSNIVSIDHAGEVNEANRFRALELLRDRCSLAALVDSEQRYNAPCCAEETRIHITRKMEHWVLDVDNSESTNPPASLFWLHGGAGVGKSALAQSLAVDFEKKGDLAASFFFFRDDSRTNNGNNLIPTLAYQLTQTFSGLDPIVAAKIGRNPNLFEKNRRTQMLKLIVEPLIRLSEVEEKNSRGPDPGLKNHPRLIVIDGLDECLDTNVQCDLLRIIADASIRLPYPLRFLIASRPESQIARIFEHELPNSPRHNLSDDSDGDSDIQIFLERQFEEIRRTHPLRLLLPSPWPLESDVSSIVKRSSNHFIYASTVIRFIQSPYHRPVDRLQVIIQLRHDEDRPYAPLDLLYSRIFLEVKRGIKEIHRALGIIYLRSLKTGLFRWTKRIWNRLTIEELLGLRPGDLILLFDPLLSLVALEQDNIRIYHKTLFDYLLDSDRSEDHTLDLSFAHEAAVEYLLRTENDLHKNPAAFQIFVYHCQFSCLNKDTTRYLQSFASNTTILDLKLSTTQELQTILYFLQVLSRPDFDFNGRWYKTFVENQTKNLFSSVPWNGWLRSIPQRFWNPTKFAEGVRSSFETFLYLDLSDLHRGGAMKGRYRRTAIDQDSIEREHEMYSLLVKKHHPEPETVYSLRSSDGDLSHSCHFATRSGDVTRVVVVSYTKDGVRLSCSEFNILEHIDFHEIMKMVARGHLENTRSAVSGDCTEVISTFLN